MRVPLHAGVCRSLPSSIALHHHQVQLLQAFNPTHLLPSFENGANRYQTDLDKQVLTVVKVVEKKLDDEITALSRLDLDDIEVLRERRLQRMKKMAEKRNRWISLSHGDYSKIPFEKDFFSVVKASNRVVYEMVMSGLRSEYGGPDFEPHVTVVRAISLTKADTVKRFRSAVDGLKAYPVPVESVSTGTFYYQCVFLLLKPSPEVVEPSKVCCDHFGYKNSTGESNEWISIYSQDHCALAIL